MIKVGSDFSGVGAFNQALMRLGIDYEEVFACDMDKYARQTFIHNYGEPKYYPKDVYERQIPTESLDIYMTSPPCQAFSLAGKRLGKDDQRGILFFNSHEFIKTNKPRYFIFENVKGLLSDDNGNTFQEWLNMLGGKSVNGLPVLFPYKDSVPYHIYYKVMNAKKHGVPQNRERVFIVGIRDDQDNYFRWAKEEHLTKRLKDVLENEVDAKYFLSEKLLTYFYKHKDLHKSKGNGFKFKPHTEKTKASNAINAMCGTRQTDPYIKIKSATKSCKPLCKYGFDSCSNLIDNFYSQDLCKNCFEGDNYQHKDDFKTIKIKSETKKGYEKSNQSALMIGTWRTHKDGNGFREIQDGNCPTIPARAREDGSGQAAIKLHNNIRRLTPRECFRLMDFPDTFTWTCSDSQAYKQAGNSIVVRCLELIIKEFNLNATL